jgi:hypothetical protein
MFISWKIPYKLDDLGVIALFQKHIYMGETMQMSETRFCGYEGVGKTMGTSIC